MGNRTWPDDINGLPEMKLSLLSQEVQLTILRIFIRARMSYGKQDISRMLCHTFGVCHDGGSAIMEHHFSLHNNMSNRSKNW